MNTEEVEWRAEVHTMVEDNVTDNQEEDRNWEIWLAGTGANCHVTCHDENMINQKVGENDRIVVGD